MKKQDMGMRRLSFTVMLILSILALLPFILLVIASFTDSAAVTANGFSFFPEKWSLEAYTYILAEWQTIGQAYLVTIFVTVVGTVLSLVITSMLGYALSCRDLPGQRVIMMMLMVAMLFNGGVVATYIIYTNLLHIKDTIWALIIPNLLMNAFNVILVKNYFSTSISPSLREAAYLDGAGEFKTFIKVVLPLSKPIMATIGLMTAIAYWNDWTNGLYYLSDRYGSQYYTIQLLLNRINDNVSYLTTHAAELGMAASSSTLPSATIRMAIAVVGIVPIIIAYPFFQGYFVKGISIGGVKE